MFDRPRSKGRVTLREEGGGRVPFDVEEMRRVVREKIEGARTEGKSADALADDVLTYIMDVASSVKLGTKYKPWKSEVNEGNRGLPNASSYRKGVYDGWALLQDVLRVEFLKRPPRTFT